MIPAEPTAEMIEAAAKALHELHCPGCLGANDYDRNKARAALTAAFAVMPSRLAVRDRLASILCTFYRTSGQKPPDDMQRWRSDADGILAEIDPLTAAFAVMPPADEQQIRDKIAADIRAEIETEPEWHIEPDGGRERERVRNAALEYAARIVRGSAGRGTG